MKRCVGTFAVGLLLGIALMWLAPGVRVEPASAQGPAGNGDVNGDGKLDIGDAIYLLSHLFSSGPAPEPIECPSQAGGLPATGQTVCYDASGGVTSCAGPTCAGQDASYKAGCPTRDRFEDNGDGTVTDTCTGLMWQKQTAPAPYNWESALRYCEGLELAGYTDWRLPNIRELHSIVDYGRLGPAADPKFQTLSDWYRSSSTVIQSDFRNYSWIIHFGNGYLANESKFNAYRVRAVRGGIQ